MPTHRKVTHDTPDKVEVGDIIYVDEVFSWPKRYHPHNYLVMNLACDNPYEHGWLPGDWIQMLDLHANETLYMERRNLRYFSIE